MKTTLLTLFAALVSVAAAYAQEPIAIDELRAPTSPAFVLLDVTPAAVERPESPKAFAVNLINAVSKAEGLPQNYAFEVAPYWLASHPALTFEKYQNPGAMGIIHTLSFSVATTPMIANDESVADPLGTRLGIGVRTNLLNGRVNPKLTQLVDELKGVQEKVLDNLKEQDDATAAIESAEEALAAVRGEGRPASDLAAAEKALKVTQARLAKAIAAEKEFDSQLDTKVAEIQALDAQRVGLIVALAAGKTWDFPEDDVSLRGPGRWGVWLTPSYRFSACPTGGECSSSIDAIAVLRALRDPDEDTTWDVGVRLVWQPTRELNISAETVNRWGGGSHAVAEDSSNRTTAMLEYRLRESLSLYATFGRDFEKETGQKPLVTLLGLNVGLGQKPKIMVEK